MLTKPTQEIAEEVLADYDRDYLLFCQKTFEDMEATNPGLADIFELLLKGRAELRGASLGVQMACVIYRQLQKASDGHLPIVEMRPALKAVAFEALEDPQDFVNKYGTPYFDSGKGLITLRTLSNFMGDSLGHGVDWQVVVFIAVFVIRTLEAQIELDLAKPASSTH